MYRNLAPIAWAILALAGCPTAAQTNMPASQVPARQAAALTLAEAMLQARQTNPELSAARHELEAAEGARVQAGALPNPTLEAQREDQRRETRTTTLTLSQPIELGGKRSARIEAAERAIDIARSQLDARKTDLEASVTSAFFAALVAQERLTLAQASLDLAQRGRDAASKRVTAGKVSPVEETKARVAEAGVRLERVQAQGELRTALSQLRAAIGPGPEIGRVDGDALNIPALPAAEEVSSRVDSAPAVREARLDARRLQALAELERAKRIPDVTLTVGAKREQELARNQAVVGISIPLPIFDTSRGNLQEALRRLDKAEDLAQAAELRVRSEATAARQRFETALAEVNTLREEVLPGAQSAFDAATKGFELGKFSYLEALDAQRTLLQSRSQYLRALAQAHQAAADLQRLLGAPGTPPSTLSKERP